MNSNEIIMVLLTEAVIGATGAVAANRLCRATGLQQTTIAMVGAVGGVALALLAAQFSGIGHFVGYLGSALDAASHATSGLTFEILFGAGVAGLLGGAAAIGLISFARHLMRS